MSKANEPILHRLGDLPIGDAFMYANDDRFTGSVIDRGGRNPEHTKVMFGDGYDDWIGNDNIVHRLIPETPATKHAEAMRRLIERVASMSARSGYPGELATEARDLLSAIARAEEIKT